MRKNMNIDMITYKLLYTHSLVCYIDVVWQLHIGEKMRSKMKIDMIKYNNFLVHYVMTDTHRIENEKQIEYLYDHI